MYVHSFNRESVGPIPEACQNDLLIFNPLIKVSGRDKALPQYVSFQRGHVFFMPQSMHPTDLRLTSGSKDIVK